MMGTRTRLQGGDEFDALTRYRRYLVWRATERRRVKQGHNQRVRKRQRLETLRHAAQHDAFEADSPGLEG